MSETEKIEYPETFWEWIKKKINPEKPKQMPLQKLAERAADEIIVGIFCLVSGGIFSLLLLATNQANPILGGFVVIFVIGLILEPHGWYLQNQYSTLSKHNVEEDKTE